MSVNSILRVTWVWWINILYSHFPLASWLKTVGRQKASCKFRTKNCSGCWKYQLCH